MLYRRPTCGKCCVYGSPPIRNHPPDAEEGVFDLGGNDNSSGVEKRPELFELIFD